MLEIIAILVVIIILVTLTGITIYLRIKKNSNDTSDFDLKQDQQNHLFNDNSSYQTNQISDEDETDEFEHIISLIKSRFQPTSFNNDEDCEKQLISFLTRNLPNKVITRGHTSKGDKLDIVIDGTYALELIIADNEEKLMFLMDLSLKSKKDFVKTAVTLVDINKITSTKIQEFSTEIEKKGIKTIMLKTNPE